MVRLLQGASPPTVVPANTAAPSIGGIKTVGQQLTGTPGSYTPIATNGYLYNWQDSADGATGWADIGVTVASYAPSSGKATKYLRRGTKGVNIIGATAAFTYSVAYGPIAAALALSGTPPTTASIGDTLAFVPTITGGHTAGAAGFSLASGTLPAGASIHATNGLVGTLTTEEVAANIVIRYTDGDGLTADLVPFTITVSAEAPALLWDGASKKSPEVTLTNGGVTAGGGGGQGNVGAVDALASGDIVQFNVVSYTTGDTWLGLGNTSHSWASNAWAGADVNGMGVYGNNGSLWRPNGSGGNSNLANNPDLEFGTGDTVNFELKVNGSVDVWVNSGTKVNVPAANVPTGPLYPLAGFNTVGAANLVELGSGGSGGGGGPPTGDTAPNALTFAPISLAARSSTVTTGTVTPNGFDTTSSLTALDAGTTDYSLDNGASWHNTVPVDFPVGTTLKLRGISPSTYETEFTLGCTLGGVHITAPCCTLLDPAYVYQPGTVAAGTQAVEDYRCNGAVGNNAALVNSTRAYLEAQGCWYDYIAPSIYFGAVDQNIVLDDFDFTVPNRPLYVDMPPGYTVTLNNPKFGPDTAIFVGTRPGNNDGQYPPCKLIINHPLIDGAAMIVTYGEVEVNDYMMKNTNASQYFLAGGGDTASRKVTAKRGFITMSDGVPAVDAHLEFGQFGGSPDPAVAFVRFEDTCMEVDKTIGTLYTNAGWTGVISAGIKTYLKNVVFKGVKRLNDWCLSVGTTPAERCYTNLAWNNEALPECDNCVFDQAPGGYAFRQTAGSNVCTAVTTCYDAQTGAELETADLN
jgi:hypothetical protein